MSKRRKLRELPKVEIHTCDACHKQTWLDARLRHYCDCNPNAPFYMVPQSTRQITEKVIGQFFNH